MPLTTPKSPRSGSTKIPPLEAGRTSAEETEQAYSQPTEPQQRHARMLAGKNMLDVASTSSHGATGSCALEGTPRLQRAGYDVLNARFTFTTTTVDGVTVHHTEGIDAAVVANDQHDITDTFAWCSTTVQLWPSTSTPWARPVRKTRPSSTTSPCPCCRSFLAWSMWKHVGRQRDGIDQPLPQACVDGMDRLLDAWQG